VQIISARRDESPTSPVGSLSDKWFSALWQKQQKSENNHSDQDDCCKNSDKQGAGDREKGILPLWWDGWVECPNGGSLLRWTACARRGCVRLRFRLPLSKFEGIFRNATTSPRCKAIVLWVPEGDCEGPGQFVAPNRLRVAGLHRCFIPESHEEITGTLAVRAFFIAEISGCLAVCTFGPIRCLDSASVDATAALIAAGFGTTGVGDPHVVTGAATLCTTGNREFSFHLRMIRLCWCVGLLHTHKNRVEGKAKSLRSGLRERKWRSWLGTMARKKQIPHTARGYGV
jgi:hypothetical protein